MVSSEGLSGAVPTTPSSGPESIQPAPGPGPSGEAGPGEAHFWHHTQQMSTAIRTRTSFHSARAEKTGLPWTGKPSEARHRGQTQDRAGGSSCALCSLVPVLCTLRVVRGAPGLQVRWGPLGEDGATCSPADTHLHKRVTLHHETAFGYLLKLIANVWNAGGFQNKLLVLLN